MITGVKITVPLKNCGTIEVTLTDCTAQDINTLVSELGGRKITDLDDVLSGGESVDEFFTRMATTVRESLASATPSPFLFSTTDGKAKEAPPSR